MDKVTADLKGADFDKKLVWRTQEGFSVKPMYRSEDIQNLKTTDSLPGQFPYIRGTKTHNNWLIRQNIAVTDINAANQKALDILEKGIDSIGFSIDSDAINPDAIASLLIGIDPVKVELNFKTCLKISVELDRKLVV